MRYSELLRTLTEEPLLITPAAHASLLQLFREHRTLSAVEFQAKREGVDVCGNDVELPQAGLDTDTGIYTIPIGGPVGVGFGKFEKGAGAVDLADVADDLAEANSDSNVRAIMLDIDSPGGMVSGTPEMADRLLAAKKPVYAFTGGMMASAAYWLGSTAERIFATRSADVGSIGVYTYFLDQADRFSMDGLKVDLIASGDFKGMGIPGTSLTKEQRELLKARVHYIANMFEEHVSDMRNNNVDAGDMLGQTFMAPQAMSRNLIDEIVSDRDEAMQIISAMR